MGRKTVEEINRSNSTRRLKEVFELIEASSLSVEDYFMQYIPTTDEERRLKRDIFDIIKYGVKDFYCAKLNPSLTSNRKLNYSAKKIPAVGKSFNWWLVAAKKLCPSRGSRLGTEREYIAFLAVLIKRLVSRGYDLELAWNTICYDSHTRVNNNPQSQTRISFETTGGKEIAGFYDLTATYKILCSSIDRHCMIVASGCSYSYSLDSPLDNFSYLYIRRDEKHNNSTGWIVLEK